MCRRKSAICIYVVAWFVNFRQLINQYINIQGKCRGFHHKKIECIAIDIRNNRTRVVTSWFLYKAS